MNKPRMQRSNNFDVLSMMNSPNFFDFPRAAPGKKKKIHSKIIKLNQSIISTRDQSQNRNVTPTGTLETGKQKVSFSRSPKDSSHSALNDMKKQLETLFESLPRISNHKTNKDLDSSSHKTSSIHRLNSVYNKDRSKSTLNYSKRHLPQINKQGADIQKLQQYLAEFHTKSKFLLEQLEHNVLGKKIVSQDRSF